MGSEWIIGRLAGYVDWIRLALDMDLWQVVVNAVMNLRVTESNEKGVQWLWKRVPT
jgi:hypothetical protein